MMLRVLSRAALLGRLCEKPKTDLSKLKPKTLNLVNDHSLPRNSGSALRVFPVESTNLEATICAA